MTSEDPQKKSRTQETLNLWTDADCALKWCHRCLGLQCFCFLIQPDHLFSMINLQKKTEVLTKKSS